MLCDWNAAIDFRGICAAASLKAAAALNRLLFLRDFRGICAAASLKGRGVQSPAPSGKPDFRGICAAASLKVRRGLDRCVDE